jgi:hypothetical protein
MPPDVGLGKPNDLYPCGYEWKAAGSGLESSRHISFRFGPKQPGDKNAITCAGQTIAVPKGSYLRVHILAASVASDQEAEFGLQSQSGVKSAKLTVGDWSGVPRPGEDAGFVALHRHSPAGDQRGAKCYLFHYTIDVDRAQPLTGIILPKNDKVRVVAITMERP